MNFSGVKKVFKGYDPTEVDKMAHIFNDEYNSLKQKYNELMEECNMLKDLQSTHNLEKYNLERQLLDYAFANKHLHEVIENNHKQRA